MIRQTVKGGFGRLLYQAMKSSKGAQWLAQANGIFFVALFVVSNNAGAGTEGMRQSVPLKGSAWLASQPESNYTLQLLAGENHDGIESFAVRRDIAAPIAIFSMRREGRTLYALVQGSYADRAAAEQAASALPAGIKPWIRTMKSIHNVMENMEIDAPQTARVSMVDATASIEDTAWVWSQNPRHYTVQVASSVDESTVEAIKQRHAFPEKAAVVQLLSEGKLWNVLVYGSFPTKHEAQGSLKELPGTIQQLNPWPRGFADLQDAISHSGVTYH